MRTLPAPLKPSALMRCLACCCALLALAQVRGCTGRELIDALVVGIDVSCRVGNAMYPDHYDRGWHITGTTGMLGSAAACSRLLGLDAKDFGLVSVDDHGNIFPVYMRARMRENARTMKRPGFALRLIYALALLAPVPGMLILGSGWIGLATGGGPAERE